MNKVLVFDMDGTIANLYGVDNWLGMLRAFNPTPYAIAEPMYDMDKLVGLLNTLKKNGWRIAVTSWLSKESNPANENVNGTYEPAIFNEPVICGCSATGEKCAPISSK